MKAKTFRNFCRFILALALVFSICDGCQPFGSGASASPISLKSEPDCSVDEHCKQHEYCFQATRKCSSCPAELCKKYLRSEKSNIRRCVKSVADCGSCLSGFFEDDGSCTPPVLLTDSEKGNRSSGPLHNGELENVPGRVISYVGITGILVVVPFLAICLVYMSKHYRKWRGSPIDGEQPEQDSLTGRSTDDGTETALCIPMEYSPPPPYAPSSPPRGQHVLFMHHAAMRVDTELTNASVQRATPFENGYFSDLQGAGDDQPAIPVEVEVQPPLGLGNEESVENQSPELPPLPPSPPEPQLVIPNNVENAVTDSESGGRAPVPVNSAHNSSTSLDSGNGRSPQPAAPSINVQFHLNFEAQGFPAFGGNFSNVPRQPGGIDLEDTFLQMSDLAEVGVIHSSFQENMYLEEQARNRRENIRLVPNDAQDVEEYYDVGMGMDYED